MTPSTEAAANIRSLLTEIRSYLTEDHQYQLSEADTKANFIEPLIRDLGWVGIRTIVREYFVSSSRERIDYVLFVQGSKHVAIEAKALRVDLADVHAAQLVQYCAIEGIEWAVLTNGRRLKVFNSFIRQDLSSKLVMDVDLTFYHNDDELQTIVDQLWHLSFSEMSSVERTQRWMNGLRLDSITRRALSDRSSSVVTALTHELDSSGVPAKPQDVVAWFHENLRTGLRRNHHPVLADTSLAEIVPEVLDDDEKTDPIPQLNPVKTGAKLFHGVRIADLVSSGILPAGTLLTLRRSGMVVATAKVTEDGTILLDGIRYRSPSDREFSRRLGRKSLNGWTEWMAHLSNETINLDVLRGRYRQHHGQP